jgi:site-specific DNA-cytosine methylase
MKLLELFSGTKSVGKVAEKLGYEVVSLDLKDADINCDILNWEYTVYPSGYFDVIWASPPCTEYSRAKTTGVRKLDHANEIVLRTLDIIKYYNPKHYIIENPQTGLLKNQSFMNDLPYVDIDYCKYGMPYRKRTRLWNNVDQWSPKPLCKKDCGSMNGNKHKAIAQRMPNGKKQDWDNQPLFKQSDLYVIPEDLIYDIFSSIH